MIRLVAKLHALRLNSDRGATAVEYGLMVALIAAVIVLTVTALGGALDDQFSNVVDDIAPAAA